MPQQRRPHEVSRAIDAVAQDRRFAPLLVLDKVGMYGFSAGGHTALSLADGRWSPALFKQHCCGIGSCGVPRPSLGGYVTGDAGREWGARRPRALMLPILRSTNFCFCPTQETVRKR